MSRSLTGDELLRDAVKRFLTLLNTKDETDSGKEFSPVTVTSVRVMLMEPLAECLKDMEKYSGYREEI